MIIGIAGTAKNTGKTTALAALIRESSVRGLPVAVTGIGYDGEERDTITLLPKPRITLPAGAIATTSERCLTVSTAGWEILHRTALFTPLGEVLILRITRPGMLVVAGPNSTSALQEVCGMMSQLAPGPVFVDGSLNRMAPMVIADSIVFATGASRTTDLTRLAEETAALEAIFSYPRGDLSGDDLDPVVSEALYDGAEADALLVRSSGRPIKIRGLIALDALRRIAEEKPPVPDLEFHDPLKILLTGDPVRTGMCLDRIRRRGTRITYAVKPALVSIIANPYYPAYHGATYSAAFLPAGELLHALRIRLHTPVTDIVQEGAGELLDRLLSRHAA